MCPRASDWCPRRRRDLDTRTPEESTDRGPSVYKRRGSRLFVGLVASRMGASATEALSLVLVLCSGPKQAPGSRAEAKARMDRRAGGQLSTPHPGWQDHTPGPGHTLSLSHAPTPVQASAVPPRSLPKAPPSLPCSPHALPAGRVPGDADATPAPCHAGPDRPPRAQPHQLPKCGGPNPLPSLPTPNQPFAKHSP